MNSIDTNVLVYATDETVSAKHASARRLLERALKAGWPIAAWAALMPPMPSSVTAHNAALNLAAEKQVQYWDALIIAICAEHGVTQLYTEDAPSAPKLLGVKCVSPW